MRRHSGHQRLLESPTASGSSTVAGSRSELLEVVDLVELDEDLLEVDELLSLLSSGTASCTGSGRGILGFCRLSAEAFARSVGRCISVGKHKSLSHSLRFLAKKGYDAVWVFVCILFASNSHLRSFSSFEFNQSNVPVSDTCV